MDQLKEQQSGTSQQQGDGGVVTGAGGGAAGGGGVVTGADGLATDDRKRQIQQQLMLLLHAHKCNRRENLNPNRRVCHVNYCKTMKAVLAHMGTCKQSKDCTMQHCASSRQILLHYKTCINSACIICYPFRQNHSVLQIANSPPGGGGGSQEPLSNCIGILKDLNINADEE
ncbi:histone acetyltransferase p300-like [Drosophila bipectinata]|uniref:histone acetyltransferase p300-like n=1 Tax=Drosophila bipectinata TaxID=42026 RepID=UPI001C8AB6BD|nr:histone acetyltransferase p300-like [Drosophila bipectinata]